MDWDRDGRLDILSGCYWTSGEEAGHILMLAGKGDLDFAEAVALQTVSGTPYVNVRIASKASADAERDKLKNICTHQCAADCDGDGDLDLVVGCFGSTFYYAENSGGVGSPELADSAVPLDVDLPGGHAGPHLADWDGDGDLDLLSGSAHGGAYLSENAGSRELPQWTAFRQLIPPASPQRETTEEPATIVPSASTRVSTIDWNGDGMLDVLLGDRAIITHRKLGLTDKEYRQQLAEYDRAIERAKEAYLEAAKEMASAQGQGKIETEPSDVLREAQEQYASVLQSKSTFLDERQTGFVWLFLRKPERALEP